MRITIVRKLIDKVKITHLRNVTNLPPLFGTGVYSDVQRSDDAGGGGLTIRLYPPKSQVEDL